LINILNKKDLSHKVH